MSDSSVIRKERTELLVGLFIIVGLAIMGVLIWQFGKFSDRLSEHYEIDVILPDASGISIGGPVRFSGEKIGFVESRGLNEDFSGVTLRLRIFEQFKIPTGSKIAVATSGLMGDNYIKISPPKEAVVGIVENDATLEAGSADLMTEVTERAAMLSDQVAIVLEEVDQMMKETRVVVANLQSVTEKLDQRVFNDENVENFAGTIEKLKATTENLAVASEKLGPLIDESRKTVETAAKPFTEAADLIAELKPAIAELKPALAKVGPTMDEFKTTAEEFGKTAKSANTAIEDIVDGDGLIAALISDKELLRDVESLIDKLERNGILRYSRDKSKSSEVDDDSDEPDGRRKPLFGKR